MTLALLPGLALAAVSGCAGREAPAPAAVPAPSGIAPQVERAERAAERGDYDTAIEAYAGAYEATPWNTRVRRALAAALAGRAQQRRERGSLPGAETDLREAVSLESEDPELRHNLALVLIERAALELHEERAEVMRADARELAPDLHAASPEVRALLERRLDLAFELLERGQLEAGIARLEALRHDYPEEPDPARMLAQAHAALGARDFDRGRFSDAADQFGRAVELYRACGPSVCERAQVVPAHQNRIIALIESARTREAREALDEAESQGMSFPELRAALPAYDFD